MDNTITYITGRRGSGKTPHIVGGDEEIGMAKIYLDKGMSTLVIDSLQHHKYAGFTYLHPSNYDQLWKAPGLYKTVIPLQHMKEFFDAGHINKVWNTQIIFEDSHKYFSPRVHLPKNVIALMGDSKQQNNDLRFMTWAWANMHPDVMRLTNYYTIFATTDGPTWRKDFLSGCLDACLKAHNAVMKGKKRFITVDSGI